MSLIFPSPSNQLLFLSRWIQVKITNLSNLLKLQQASNSTCVNRTVLDFDCLYFKVCYINLKKKKYLFFFQAMSKINHEKQPVIVFLRCNWHNLCPNRNLWWPRILPCCAICRVYLCPHNNTLGTLNRECSRKEVRVIWYLNLDPVLISKFAWIYIMLFIFPCTANRL